MDLNISVIKLRQSEALLAKKKIHTGKLKESVQVLREIPYYVLIYCSINFSSLFHLSIATLSDA